MVEGLETIPQHCMPRYIGISESRDEAIEYTLVCFCDALAKVYSAAIYLCH